MNIIVGLGNPGAEYQDTRHNIGFMVVDRLARELGKENAVWSEEKKHQAYIAKAGNVLLVKPTTFMNDSGLAVSRIVSYYKVKPVDVWVIHDDLDLPLGKIRIRMGGASAGHHGVNSMIGELKTDAFLRIRLGIGRGKEDKTQSSDRKIHPRKIINFVLSHFTQSEAGSLKHLVKNGTEAIRIALTEGIDKAMNRFN